MSKFVKDIKEFDRNQPFDRRVIYLDVGDWNAPQCGLYSYDHSDIDEFLVKLADLSITQKIVKVSRELSNVFNWIMSLIEPSMVSDTIFFMI